MSAKEFKKWVFAGCHSSKTHTPHFRVAGVLAFALVAKVQDGFAAALSIAILALWNIQVVLAVLDVIQLFFGQQPASLLCLGETFNPRILAFAFLTNIRVHRRQAAIPTIIVTIFVIELIMAKAVFECSGEFVQARVVWKIFGTRHDFHRVV